MITIHPELRRALHEARSREAVASARPRRTPRDRAVTPVLRRVPRAIAAAAATARDVLAGREVAAAPRTVPDPGGLR
jgi:hypothetical protein